MPRSWAGATAKLAETNGVELTSFGAMQNPIQLQKFMTCMDWTQVCTYELALNFLKVQHEMPPSFCPTYSSPQCLWRCCFQARVRKGQKERIIGSATWDVQCLFDHCVWLQCLVHCILTLKKLEVIQVHCLQGILVRLDPLNEVENVSGFINVLQRNHDRSLPILHLHPTVVLLGNGPAGRSTPLRRITHGVSAPHQSCRKSVVLLLYHLLSMPVPTSILHLCCECMFMWVSAWNYALSVCNSVELHLPTLKWHRNKSVHNCKCSSTECNNNDRLTRVTQNQEGAFRINILCSMVSVTTQRHRLFTNLFLSL